MSSATGFFINGAGYTVFARRAAVCRLLVVRVLYLRQFRSRTLRAVLAAEGQNFDQPGGGKFVEKEDVLAAFDEIARRRGWRPLHTPKNLAMALSVEVAELCRHLQWRSDGEIEQLMQTAQLGQLAAELADIQMYLLKLSDVLGVDMDRALRDKIAENRRRF